MQIAGIQKLTLVDFPGQVAATVFTRGCSFRCGFCHNPELVIPEQFVPLLDEQEIFNFLETRYGKLSGICITGGEPLLQKDISKFIAHIKALGFNVKLDTNGSFPEKLAEMIKKGDIDYIAMDIKSSLPKYAMTIFNNQFPITNQLSNSKNSKSPRNSVISTHDSFLSSRPIENPPLGGMNQGKRSYHTDTKLIENIKRSIKLVMSSGIPYEFRTTVCHPYHEVADFEEMGKMIKGAEKYYIQNFVKSKQVDEKENFTSFSDRELEQAKKIMKKYVKFAEIR